MNPLPRPLPGPGRGFTLIEVMITVAIVALLAAIALPSYQEHIRRTHRAHARAALLQAAQWLERAATARGAYPLATAVPATLLAVEGGRYQLSFDASGPTNTTFTLLATPQASQAEDRCGVYTLTHTGLRTQRASARVAAPDDATRCWDR